MYRINMINCDQSTTDLVREICNKQYGLHVEINNLELNQIISIAAGDVFIIGNLEGFEDESVITKIIDRLVIIQGRNEERRLIQKGMRSGCIMAGDNIYELSDALDRIMADIEKKKLKHQILLGNSINKIVVELQNVEVIESEKRQIHIFESGEKRSLYMKLDELEKMLPLYFVRCHQSYLINLNYVASFGKKEIIMKSGKRIPVSRSHHEKTFGIVNGFWEKYLS